MDVVFDLEGDGLNPTRIHCLVYYDGENYISLTSYKDMRNIIKQAKRLIGHNITRFDIPVLERILNIKVEAELVDTLALSWYLYPKRLRHGLEEWGEFFGREKPKIDNWDNLPLEDYIHRCREDVKNNVDLWNKQQEDLLELYGSEKKYNKLIRYLQFKMYCAKLQEESRWKLDVDIALKSLERLTQSKERITRRLAKVMPQIAVTAKRSRPKKPFKQDGSWSKTGEAWFELLRDNNKPEDFQGELEIITGYKEPNPDSHQQVKDWLFKLGWKPANFKYVREKFGTERKIPQVRIEGDDGKELCPSVILLSKKYPEVKLLEEITILAHRISILEGFLENVDEGGYVQAKINGFTNTLRFKHKEVVNLPGVSKAYGEDIRGCLIAPEGYELCGSDMSSLEDRTKQHYMWDYDPDYVTEMNVPGFDPHLDIAVLANMLTQEQADDHKAKRVDYTGPRYKAKTTNYSATYKISPLGLSRRSGMSLNECEKLLDIFWKRNWSLRAIADDQEIKTIGNQMWLYNPVSKLWYSLRHEKDIFSTLNQGTGTYCFDCWVKEIISVRPQLTAQFHDEVVLCVKKGHREKAVKLLKDSIRIVNEKLKLNRELDVDVQFGDRYSEIH